MTGDDEKNDPFVRSQSSEKSFRAGIHGFGFSFTVKTSEVVKKITLESCKVEMIQDKKRTIFLHLIGNDGDLKVKTAVISTATGELAYLREVSI